ncbi:hypothetical protein J4E86_011072 [Alternaria arbusti]|uniref:uncharacterized protein n=1 Tax=Alternaria arbusti TaxID=232088 RepID=UPI0022200C6E|nr:uncharacterized protein J4E86_011072 [Alternaria arbusti]KAI4940267.1 hypothetical protein J4E86_011072 [Alternaria arbusti]
MTFTAGTTLNVTLANLPHPQHLANTKFVAIMSSTQTHDDDTLKVTTGHSPRGIGDLPPELLLKIADFAAVTDTNSKKILCKLCLVKPLNPTATEALYANIHAGADFNPVLLIRTLLSHPSLAALYAVEGHYRKLKLPELSIMVSTRPWEIPFLPGPLLQTLPNYNLLKNITIRTPHIDIDRIAKLLQLPNLHQLEVWNLRELQPRHAWHWDAALFPNHTSTVRHLTLRGGYLHVDVLTLD